MKSVFWYASWIVSFVVVVSVSLIVFSCNGPKITIESKSNDAQAAAPNQQTYFRWNYKVNPNIGSGEITAVCLNGVVFYLAPNGSLTQMFTRTSAYPVIPQQCTE